MHKQHPLTNKKALSLFSSDPLSQRLMDTSSLGITIEEAMRTAADWQLEEVMTWLEGSLSNYADDGYFNELIPDLEEAMRPQQQMINDLSSEELVELQKKIDLGRLEGFKKAMRPQEDS